MLNLLNWVAVIAVVLFVLWVVTLAEIAARKGRGYSAQEDMPPDARPPRETCISPKPRS